MVVVVAMIVVMMIVTVCVMVMMMMMTVEAERFAKAAVFVRVTPLFLARHQLVEA